MNKFLRIAFALLSFLFVSANSFGQNYKDGEYAKDQQSKWYTYDDFYKVDNLNLLESSKKRAKNVIILIGDGMGANHIYALEMLNGGAYITQIPRISFSQTSNIEGKTTDSGAGGTAIACGKRTNNGKIGIDANGNSLKSILNYAQEMGKSVGLVATSTIVHATPAAFYAHNNSRSNYEDIAIELLNTQVDYFAGGGMNYFSKRSDGIDLISKLGEKKYKVVTNLDDLDRIKSGRVAALFSDDHQGKAAERPGQLLKSSTKALEVLSQDKDGFFLMIEGSQIDWAAHDNNMPYLMGEMREFDMVVGEVLKWAKNDGNTLVIVTADHETGGFGVLDKGENSLEFSFSSNSHTDVMVPVFTYGPSSFLFNSVYDNTELFNLMLKAMK